MASRPHSFLCFIDRDFEHDPAPVTFISNKRELEPKGIPSSSLLHLLIAYPVTLNLSNSLEVNTIINCKNTVFLFILFSELALLVFIITTTSI